MPRSRRSEPPEPPAAPRRWLTVEGDCSEAIAAVLEEELRSWAGTWAVEMDAGLVGGWCAYRIRRDDGAERTLLFGPEEHDPAFVRESLARVLAALPPRPQAVPVLVPLEQERRAVQRR